MEIWHFMVWDYGRYLCYNIKKTAHQCKKTCDLWSCSFRICNNSLLHNCTHKTISKLAFAESRMSIPRPASPDIVACIHNGHIYKDGQNFPSNSTGMKVNSPNQCVQCRCQVTADYITKKLISQQSN